MNIKSIVLGIIGINLVIAVHELGHWTLCKAFQVDTPHFSIGLGPTIIEKKIANTNFTLALLPLGGYVEIAGMRNIHTEKKAHSFNTKPYIQKLSIVLGGVLFNCIFSFIILMFFGFQAPPKKHYSTKEPEAPGKAYEKALGPLGILSLTATSASYGIRYYTFFLALLSLNLAFFNLIPFPILYGGHLVIITFEAISQQPLSEALYNTVTTFTTLLLLFLLSLLTIRDIRRILS